MQFRDGRGLVREVPEGEAGARDAPAPQPRPKRDLQLVFRGDLVTVHYDPHHAAGIAAYIPEAHASSACPRALKGGRPKVKVDKPDEMAWCDTCTVADTELATIRKVNGHWVPIRREDGPVSNDRS